MACADGHAAHRIGVDQHREVHGRTRVAWWYERVPRLLLDADDGRLPRSGWRHRPRLECQEIGALLD